MGEEEPVNTVSKTDSNGNITLEKTLDDTSEKKDCEPKGGKILEKNANKDLKEDGIKEMEVDKKADGGEALEKEEDKKADDGEVIKDNNKVGGVEVLKDGQKVYQRGKLKAARKKVGTKESDDKKDDFVNEMEENKKDDNGFEKSNEEDKAEDIKVEKRLKKCGRGKTVGEESQEGGEDDKVDDKSNEDKDDIEIVKLLKKRGRGKVDVEKMKKKIKEQKDTNSVSDVKNESSENDERQEREEDGKDKVDNRSNEDDAAEDIEVEKGLKKRGRAKVDVEKTEKKIKEQETKGIHEGKNESSEKDERQEGEEECKDKVDNKSNEEDAAKDIEVEKGLKKRGRRKVDVEKMKKKINEHETKGIPEGKSECSENNERQEGEEDGKDKVDNKSNEEDGDEDVEVEKGLLKRVRGNIDAEQAENDIKEPKETEPRTPTTTNRPVRERKSVNRLIESDETDASKEFHIEKGRGTPLKDIPNVAFKLSRRTVDDNLKLLHTILFSRRGKASEIKNNISSFSGFVWHENEEKQMIKVKEKFDKCNKENLTEFCDVLDMPVTNANTRKEDIIAKLIDYLVAPKAAKTALLAEQEKSIKGKKRIAKQGSSRSETAMPRSAKSRKKNEDSSVAEKRMITTDTENEAVKEDKVEEKNKNNVPDNSEDEKPIQEKKRKRIAIQDSPGTGIARSRRSVKSRKKNEDSEVAEVRKRSTDAENEAEEGQKDGKGVPDKSKDEIPETPENEDKIDSGKESEDVKKVSKTTRTSSRLKESAGKSKAKKTAVETKPRTERKRTSKKPLSTHSESDHDDSEGSPKVFSRKKKNVKKGKQKSSSLTKSSSKDKTGKVSERKDKNKEKSNPSDDQLREGIRDLLKVVDFNTATFADTVKLLGKRFNVDLTPRKASIKTIIQEELTKLVAEDDEKAARGEEVEDRLKNLHP